MSKNRFIRNLYYNSIKPENLLIYLFVDMDLHNNTCVLNFINKISIVDIVLTYSGSLLSILGAILLFLVHYLKWVNGKVIDDARKFLLFLTLADLGNAIGYFWGISHYIRTMNSTEEHIPACQIKQEPGCIGQSFVTTAFTMSSFFWTALIAFHLYSKYGMTLQQGTSYRRWISYCMTGWGIPFVITIVAVSLNKLGSDLSVGSGAWCWISACLLPEERTLWMTISGKGWEILMYCFCFACYILIKWEKIKTRRRLEKNNATTLTPRYRNEQQCPDTKQEDDIRFLLLWMVEVVLRISGTIRYIVAVYRRHNCDKLPSYDPVDEWFLHFQSFGDSAQAFCSCLLFCFEKESRDILIAAATRKTKRTVVRQSIRQANESVESETMIQNPESGVLFQVGSSQIRYV